ncbi:MAG: hypothetical protein Q8O30_07750 [Candidatus Omnitrophota bacterium]|nr:hypothetical protein [Candidatus Omnitrophota bacterium]
MNQFLRKPMPIYLKALILFFVFGVSGCATLSHMDELLTLKSVADSQNDIERYLAKQEKGFNKLLSDIKNNRLKVGITKKYIITTYSEPILVKSSDKDQTRGEILLYRHPTNYFKSDRIYLYIDENNRLIIWELKPTDS